jgi:4'-phosphopantetheinyl transferase
MAPPAREVWSVDLGACGSALLARVDLIADDDRARALRLDNPDHRRERLCAHAALRVVLKRHGVDDGEAHAFVRLASGKPVLSGHWSADEVLARDGVDFSLSHIDGVALIAISRGARIGVDVERVRSVAIEAPRRVAIEAAADALADAGPLVATGDERRLQQAWTRLEALAKARGVGMARQLAEIGVVGPAWGARKGGEADGAPGRAFIEAAQGYYVRDLDCGAGPLVAAVAASVALTDTPALRRFPVDAVLADGGTV